MSKLNLSLTVEQATGSTTPILVEVSEVLEWVTGPDGKRHPGDRIGTGYTVLMQQSGCAPLVVKTEELTAPVSAEAVADACLSGQFIRVRFDNFKASPYQGKNGLGISATADKCTLVSTPSKN